MITGEDVYGRVLFESGNHKFIWLGTDEQENEGVVQTNQYLIIHDGKGVLLDPGGVHLFARVVSVVSRYIDLEKIETIVFSHQDPDVSSGIALWLGVTRARIYISSLWIRFIPHFGIVDNARIQPIEGIGDMRLPAMGLRFIPAHFLHSTGNFCVYDEVSKILFSADIGTAVFSRGGQYLFVEDFAAHVERIEGFHKRYMTSNIAIRAFLARISKLDIQMITPQHGAVYRDQTVRQFLDWLANLQCGLDIIDSIYGKA